RGEFAMMRFNKGLADGKSEAEPAQLRPFSLFERIKNLRQRLRVYPHSAVRYLNAQLPVVIPGPDLKPAAFRRELHGVLDQVPKYLLQTRRIGFQTDLVRGEIGLERKIFVVDVGLANLEGIAQECMSIHQFEAQLDFAFADSRQVEQIVDQARFELHISSNH